MTKFVSRCSAIRKLCNWHVVNNLEEASHTWPVTITINSIQLFQYIIMILLLLLLLLLLIIIININYSKKIYNIILLILLLQLW